MALSDEARKAKNAYQKAYRERNIERIREYEKEWRHKNPDRVRATMERYWQKKAEQMKQGE